MFNIIKKMKIGSSSFFEKFDDYKSKDIDWICIVDSLPNNEKVLNAKIKTDDIFFYPVNMSKDDFIKQVFDDKVPMKVGKFIVPEFIEYIGFTISELKQFNKFFNELDDKHKYEKIIYNAYLENNKFELSEDQLNKAYLEYKKYR